MKFLKEKKFYSVFIFIVIMYSLLVFVANSTLLVASDFLNYYVGATLVKEGNAKLLYDATANYSTQEKVLGSIVWKNINTFRPLPFVAMLFVPLAYFSAINAFKLFALINILIVCVFVLISKIYFKKVEKISSILFLLAFFYLPVLDNFLMGQVSILLATLFLLIYGLLKSQKSKLSGILSALLLIKTQYLIFVPFIFLLSKDKKKFVASFLITFIFLSAISVFLVGIDQMLYYPKFLSITETEQYGSRPHDFYSFYGFLSNLPLINIEKSLAFLINATVYLLVLVIFFTKVGKLNLEDLFVSMTVFVLALSVHAFSFDLSFLLVPIFIILEKIIKKSGLRANLDFVVASTLFVLPALKMINKSYYASIILIFIGFCIIFRELLKKHLAVLRARFNR